MSVFAKISVAVRKPVINLVNKPTPVTYIGCGKVKEMGNLLTMVQAKKVLVITDNFLNKMGLLDNMLKSIKDANINVVVFDGVLPDPTFTIVEAAEKCCVGCDAVVAIGGGSVLDTAKAVSAAVANNKSAIQLSGLLKVKKRPLPFIAVPTTAGTGSETTVAAIISDPSTHSKKQILDPKLVPIMAVLDAELTTGLPPHTTAFTAIDALTHALEAYVAKYATEETDCDARIATKLIYENLPKVQQEPSDLVAREALLVASFFAGMAFTRTYVGYVHAFAHTIGGKFGVPHGLANAILLPHVMQYYLPVCAQQFAELADLVNVCNANDTNEVKSRKFVESLFALNKQFNIPERFEKFPLAEIDGVITQAFKECHGTYPVPRYFTKADARELLKKVCNNEI